MEKKQWTRNRPKQAYKLALLGATDKEIAEFMEVSEYTLTYWKRVHPEFKKWLNKGKTVANARVAKALFRRAIGYSHPEDHISVFKGEAIITPTIKHYPPDSWACVKWLSIREREKWADIERKEIIETLNVNSNLDLSGFSNEELMILKKAGLRNVAIKQLKENVSGN